MVSCGWKYEHRLSEYVLSFWSLTYVPRSLGILEKSSFSECFDLFRRL